MHPKLVGIMSGGGDTSLTCGVRVAVAGTHHVGNRGLGDVLAVTFGLGIARLASGGPAV